MTAELVPYKEPNLNIRATFTFGTVSLRRDHPEFDNKGRVVGWGHIVEEWDDNGRITRHERIPSATRLVYNDEPNKKWWEIWK